MNPTIWAPITFCALVVISGLFVWYIERKFPDSEPTRISFRGGYQPSGPSIGPLHPPKGGSGVPKAITCACYKEKEGLVGRVNLDEKHWTYDKCPHCGEVFRDLDFADLLSNHGHEWTCPSCGAENRSHITVFTATFKSGDPDKEKYPPIGMVKNSRNTGGPDTERMEHADHG